MRLIIIFPNIGHKQLIKWCENLISYLIIILLKGKEKTRNQKNEKNPKVPAFRKS